MPALLVSGAEACKRLQINWRTFDNMVKAGAIPGPISGTRRKYYWPALVRALEGTPGEGRSAEVGR